MDLARWYVDRRWVALLELIDMLPAATRFVEAITQDRELAEQMLDAEEEQGEDHGETAQQPPPRLSEFTLTNKLLTDLLDSVQALTALTAKAHGSNPDNPTPAPRPVTAMAEAREERELENTRDFVSQFGFGPEDF